MNREYKKTNEQWLAEKSQEADVQRITEGVFYKILKSGDPTSPSPTPRDIVNVHYTGWTIDGKKFDSSRGETPLAIRLRDLIEGWVIALQRMHVGDQWEIYLSADRGYGKFSQPGLPANSTLIFEIELLGIA